MEIQILQLVEGAKKATGTAVIIDVFRAFTTACVAMDNHAKTILPIANLSLAYTLKKEHPDFILMGERDEVIQEGFDYGNSPANIQYVDFCGKTIIHTTSAGTQGIQNASSADEILTGSLVNAPAIAAYLRKKAPKTVSLVCMGKAALHPTEEDTICAQYIKSLLEGTPYPIAEKIQSLRHGEGQRFFRPDNQKQCPKEDFTIATDVGRFSFILKAVLLDPKQNIYQLIKEDISLGGTHGQL